MKRIFMLALMWFFHSQILYAVDTLSQSEVVNTVLRENPSIKVSSRNFALQRENSSGILPDLGKQLITRWREVFISLATRTRRCLRRDKLPIQRAKL